MVEDYRINQRIGHCEQTGAYEITRMKTRRAVKKFAERFRTNKGDFLPEEWRKQIMEEVIKDGKKELLEKIKVYCKQNCAWLHTEDELEEYALNCLASHAYEHWENFK